MKALLVIFLWTVTVNKTRLLYAAEKEGVADWYHTRAMCLFVCFFFAKDGIVSTVHMMIRIAIPIAVVAS